MCDGPVAIERPRGERKARISEWERRGEELVNNLEAAGRQTPAAPKR